MESFGQFEGDEVISFPSSLMDSWERLDGFESGTSFRADDDDGDEEPPAEFLALFFLEEATDAAEAVPAFLFLPTVDEVEGGGVEVVLDVVDLSWKRRVVSLSGALGATAKAPRSRSSLVEAAAVLVFEARDFGGFLPIFGVEL